MTELNGRAPLAAAELRLVCEPDLARARNLPAEALSHRVIPISAGRTMVQCQWLFPAELASDTGFDPAYAVDFWDITNRQDFAACESVYRGMTSLGYRPGVFDERERFVRGFQAQVAQSYLQGHWVRVQGDLLGALPSAGELTPGGVHA